MLRILEKDKDGNLKPVSLAEQRKRIGQKGSTENVGVDPKTGTTAGKEKAGK